MERQESNLLCHNDGRGTMLRSYPPSDPHRTSPHNLVRPERIELSTSGWQPEIIPFNYERIMSQSREDLNLLSLVRNYEQPIYLRNRTVSQPSASWLPHSATLER